MPTPPPPGFVIGEPTTVKRDIPPPPPGFVLENAPASQGGVEARRGLSGTMEQPIDSPEKSASFWTTLKAGLNPDVVRQVEAFADARGIPVNRYGITEAGDVVYQDDNGNMTREIPSVTGAEGVVDFFKRLGQNVGYMFGPSSGEAAGGAVLTYAPGPWKATAPVVAAGVDLARQGVGNVLNGRDPTDVDYFNALGHGAMTGVAGGAGRLYQRYVEGARPFGVSGYDASQLGQPGAMANVRQATDEAADLGIQLTPGEAMTSGAVPGRNSVLRRERQLTRTEQGGDVMVPFYQGREEVAVPGAIGRTQNAMGTAPQGIGGQAERQFTTAADNVVEHYVGLRQRAASPHYEAAFTSGVEVPPQQIGQVVRRIETEIERVPENSGQRRMLERVRNMIAPERPSPGGQAVRQPETDLERLHGAKLELDAMIDDIRNGTLSVDRVSLRRLEGIQNDLTNRLRQAHPEYEAGYQAFRAASPAVDDATNLTATLRRQRQGDLGYDTSIASVFSRGDPTSIGRLRAAYMDAGQEQAWNQGLGSYIESQAANYAKQQAPSKGFAKWMRDPKAQRNLRAAMTPQQWRAWETLSRAMQRVASAPPEGSPTATDLNTAINFEGKPSKFFGKLMEGVSLDILPRIGQSMRNWSAGRNAGRLAEAITNPQAVEQLERIRLMGLTGRRLTYATMAVLAETTPWLFTGNSPRDVGFASGTPSPQ